LKAQFFCEPHRFNLPAVFYRQIRDYDAAVADASFSRLWEYLARIKLRNCGLIAWWTTISHMQFWRLTHPNYDSDYKHSYINGELEHPFGFPGVHCDVCHQTWGGCRILPFELPASLRAHKHLKERWPISLEQHQALQREVQEEFRRAGVVVPSFRPGDDFQPCYLDIPSRPRADFIWGCLGSVVISERVRRLFESLRLASVSYSPVTLRKVGKREARLPAPIPSTGEPEDIIHEVPLVTLTDTVGP
jgi:hypothetical protein